MIHPLRILVPFTVLAGLTRADDAALFARAAQNQWPATEAFVRSHRYVEGWLAHADPKSGLLPRNLRKENWFWNGKDAAADNYSFMVLTAAMTDRPLLEGRLLDLLRAEEKLTSRIGHLPEDFDFRKQGWRRTEENLDELIFEGAEYCKDGLLYITEWMGQSPWTDRMLGIVDDIWKLAPVDTPFGKIPTLNKEVNGDMLQLSARLYWYTGDRKYLDWGTRLGDYFLLGTNHPTRDWEYICMSDHECEIINGLSELYVAVAHAMPEKKKAYEAPLHALYDRILEIGRNEHGLLHGVLHADGRTEGSLTDNWGYDYDGIYTTYLIDGTAAYRDAVRKPLTNLSRHYRKFPWQAGGMDGYADSIEGAITLFNRERIPSVANWLDSEIQVLWRRQRGSGVIESWHADGNFARTSLMYALWKTQGCRVEPWRHDVRVGAVTSGNQLFTAVSAHEPWTGRLVFDHARHRTIMKLPLDYPRINQFPEWYTVEATNRYVIAGAGPTRIVEGRELIAGLPLEMKAGETLNLCVAPAR